MISSGAYTPVSCNINLITAVNIRNYFLSSSFSIPLNAFLIFFALKSRAGLSRDLNLFSNIPAKTAGVVNLWKLCSYAEGTSCFPGSINGDTGEESFMALAVQQFNDFAGTA